MHKLAAPADTTTLVIDTRTSRIIFYTVLEPHTIAAHPEHWVATTPTASLPSGMALANCYSYKFDSGRVVGSPAPKSANTANTLLNENKRAMQRLLRERLAALWGNTPPWELLAQPQEALQAQAQQFVSIQADLLAKIAAATGQADIDAVATRLAHMKVAV